MIANNPNTMDSQSQKYHQVLADYFMNKSLQFNPTQWDKCPTRILTELPFQLLLSDKTQQLENVLCNPLFSEASIKKGLLNNLIEDLNNSVGKDSLINIIPIKNSILNGITAIRLRPLISVYTIMNRLVQNNNNCVVSSFIELTQRVLNERGVWMRTQTPFPVTQYKKGIIEINTSKKVFYVHSDNKIISYDFDTHKLKSIRYLLSDKTYYNISIQPITEKVATLDNKGKVAVELHETSFTLLHNQNCFSWLGESIIGINIQNYLVSIDLEKSTESILWKIPILSHSFFTVSRNAKSGIVVSGDRPSNQFILFLQTINGQTHCSELEIGNNLVTTACLDETGGFVLLVTISRELILFNTNTKELTNISCRFAGELPVRGRINKCILHSTSNTQISVLATTDGELLMWNTTEKTIRRKGSFRGLQELISIQNMDMIPNENKLLLVTNKSIEIINIFDDKLYMPKLPLKKCCFSGDDWFISLDDLKIEWFKADKYMCDFILPSNNPVSITSFGNDGTVVVGFKNGTIVKLHPNQQPEKDDAIDLFDGHPIVSVLNWGNNNILAVSKNCQFKIANFESNPTVKEIKCINSIREEQKACSIGRNHDFVTCGQYHFGDSLNSVIVIRENDSRELVFECKEIVIDIAASENDNSIFAVFAGSVNYYRLANNNKWKLVNKRTADVINIAVLGDRILAVVLLEKGMYWLELWSIENNLETICSIELPFQCTTIEYKHKVIVLGTVNGDHFSVNIISK